MSPRWSLHERTGLSQADADRRVSDVVTQAKADMDGARKAAAQLAFWLMASLLFGAFCASLAATEGGGLRDGTWRRIAASSINLALVNADEALDATSANV